MSRPPFGLCFPARLVRVRDGDTPVVSCMTNLVWAVRLIECWCPETKGNTRSAGRRSTLGAIRLLDGATDLALQVPAPDRWREEFERREAGTWPEGLNPLALFTFDRVPGFVWLDQKRMLNEELVRLGYATRTKEECLAKWGKP